MMRCNISTQWSCHQDGITVMSCSAHRPLLNIMLENLDNYPHVAYQSVLRLLLNQILAIAVKALHFYLNINLQWSCRQDTSMNSNHSTHRVIISNYQHDAAYQDIHVLVLIPAIAVKPQVNNYYILCLHLLCLQKLQLSQNYYSISFQICKLKPSKD